MRRQLYLLFFLQLSFSSNTYSQEALGSISGTVRDVITGELIPFANTLNILMVKSTALP